MAAQSGDQMAVALLRVLPADVAGQVLDRLDPTLSTRLRSTLQNAGQPGPDQLDAALGEFFDLLRVAGTAAGGGSEAAAGEYRPVAKPRAGTDSITPPQGSEPPPDPIAALRELPTDKLLKVLEGEQPTVTALLLTVLDPTAAGAVLKGLPAEERAKVAVRYSQPGTRNYQLVQQLARAVTEKGRRLAEQPSEAPPDARITDLAAMLRGLPRQERFSLFEKMTESDPQLTERVKAKLFKFTDVLKLEDRALQGILSQLNLKVIATALKGADEAVTAKLTNNISSRARELLQEEMGLLGAVSPSKVEEAQNEVAALLRKGEEEGKFEIGE